MGRYWVLAGLFVLSLITYIDRAAISSAKDAIAGSLALDDRGMGAVFSAFALGYALAQIPAGWLADRYGPRLALTSVVVSWSILTAATGSQSALWPLLATRFLFGAAEAGAYPGSARAFYNWLSSGERGIANGIIFAGSRLGAAGAFPAMAWLLSVTDWRTAFLILAVPGIAWGAAWYLWFRDEPDVPPQRDDPEEAERLPLALVVISPKMLLAMFQYFAVNFTTFLCLTWMLPYLKQRYLLSASSAAYYAMVPLLVGATAQWFTGALVDRLYRSEPWRPWSRRLPAISGFIVSSIGIASIAFAPSVEAATACFTVAAFGAEMVIAPSWAFCMDIGGRRSGAVTGSMNMLGNLGSFVSANLFPYLQGLTGDATAYFFTVLVLNLASAICWLGMKRPEATS